MTSSLEDGFLGHERTALVPGTIKFSTAFNVETRRLVAFLSFDGGMCSRRQFFGFNEDTNQTAVVAKIFGFNHSCNNDMDFNPAREISALMVVFYSPNADAPRPVLLPHEALLRVYYSTTLEKSPSHESIFKFESFMINGIWSFNNALCVGHLRGRLDSVTVPGANKSRNTRLNTIVRTKQKTKYRITPEISRHRVQKIRWRWRCTSNLLIEPIHTLHLT